MQGEGVHLWTCPAFTLIVKVRLAIVNMNVIIFETLFFRSFFDCTLEQIIQSMRSL